MKKVLKYGAFVLVGICTLVALAALYIQLAGVPRYETKPVVIKVDVTPERAIRGKHLASMLCNHCHLNPSTKLLSGKKMDDVPTALGIFYSRNITKHLTKGIGSWTDGELAYLLRTGIQRDGDFTPAMVMLPRLDDDDILSIIAYLRSDDPTVQPSEVENKDSKPTLFAKFLARIGAFKPSAYPTQPQKAPNLATEKVAYGKYLATSVLGCSDCHSADFATNDPANPENSKGFMAGGNLLLDVNGRETPSPNITPDKETGIGSWSEQDFIQTLKTGFTPAHKPMRYPMQRYFELKDEEIAAIYAYLRTVPAIHNPRKPAQTPDLASAKSEGQRLYYLYSCFSCHGETGVGWGDLTKADQKYPTNDILKDFLKNPVTHIGETKMLKWEGVIQEEHYEALCNYVRELGKKSAQTQTP